MLTVKLHLSLSAAMHDRKRAPGQTWHHYMYVNTITNKEKSQIQGSCIHMEQRSGGKTPNIILFQEYFMSNNKK